MKADYLTYRRATSESVRGLILQVAMAIVMLVYALWAGDTVARSIAVFIGIGTLAWLTLTIVYDQHRRERIEALENEALANAPTANSSVFEAQEEFSPAARRLAALYRFFVPAMSLVIGGLLTGMGVWLFMLERGRYHDPIRTGEATLVGHEGWALGVGITIGFLGFVFARYTAGLARVPAFANLRAGSSYAVGAAILGALLAVAKFTDTVGSEAPVRWLMVGVPAFMTLIGVECFINFVLGIYRPRKAGETPRPAFDSRLLGMAAAPDRIAQSINEAINYQLGFDVTGGWFYQLLSKWLLPLGVFGLLIVWGLSCVVVVQPHQRAIVMRFGRPVTDHDLEPGAHLKAPWPIDTVYVPEFFKRDEKGRLEVTDYTATGLRLVDLGTTAPASTAPILWTNDHAGEEVYQYVRASSGGGGDGSAGAAELGDIAIVSVEAPMQYEVSNVLLFNQLAEPEKRDDLLRSVARRELTLYMQRATLDDILGGKRAQMSLDLWERVQRAFDNLNPGPDGKPRGAGVKVVFLGITGVHPPKDVAPAFEGPVEADQRREANIDDAMGYATERLAKNVGNAALARTIVTEINTFERMSDAKADKAALDEQELKVQGLIESAGGAAAEALAQARADRWKAHMGTRGMAIRHQGQLAMYDAAPEYYRASIYFEALKTAMAKQRVYITSEDVPDLRINSDQKAKDIGVDVFKKPE